MGKALEPIPPRTRVLMSPGLARARPSVTMVKILEYIYVTSHPTAPPQVVHGYAGDSSDSNIVSESK